MSFVPNQANSRALAPAGRPGPHRRTLPQMLANERRESIAVLGLRGCDARGGDPCRWPRAHTARTCGPTPTTDGFVGTTPSLSSASPTTTTAVDGVQKQASRATRRCTNVVRIRCTESDDDCEQWTARRGVAC